MSRIAGRFQALRAQRRSALVCFITAGDPSPAITVSAMHALVGAGADILELGVPFSDPMADGPVIQRASERALRAGATLTGVFDMVRGFRQQDAATPVVLMGYLNPFESLGYEPFAAAAGEAGVDGVITVDLPPEEGAEFVPALRRHGLDPIFLLAPTSSATRIARISAEASGFVYYVSLKGVTGAANLDTEAVAAKVAEIRTLSNLPVGVGFGIRDADSAARVAAISDAVVVGSALVELMERLGSDEAALMAELGSLVSTMRKSMDTATGASPS